MFMDWLSVFNYLFWLPVVLWVGYFCFSRYVSYPIALRKLLRRGEVWVYIPQWWKTRKAFWVRFCSVLISMMTILFSTLTACWIIWLFFPAKAFLGFFVVSCFCSFFSIFI